MFSFNEFINPKLKKKSDPYKERLKIFSDKNKNLRFLLENRFLWMKPFLKNKKKIIEVGSGTGCIQLILKKKIILTDLIKYPWINKKINMTRMNLEKKYLNKVDIFIVNQTLHHCPNPAKTLKKMLKYLKKGGLIFIDDVVWLPYIKNASRDNQFVERINRLTFNKILEIYNTNQNNFSLNINFYKSGLAIIRKMNNKKLNDEKTIINRMGTLKNIVKKYFYAPKPKN